MERLGSAKWYKIFKKFRALKKVEKHWSTSESLFTVNRFKLAPEFLPIIEKWDRIFGGSFQVNVFVVQVKSILFFRVLVERLGKLNISQETWMIKS